MFPAAYGETRAYRCISFEFNVPLCWQKTGERVGLESKAYVQVVSANDFKGEGMNTTVALHQLVLATLIYMQFVSCNKWRRQPKYTVS